jgi:hypothetical protein
MTLMAVDAAGDPLSGVTLAVLDPAEMPALPGGIYTFAGYACIAGPEDAAFSPAVMLAFNFTEDQWDDLSSGGQGALVVQQYNRSTETWEEVSTTVSPETRSVEAEVLHLSAYALFAAAPEDGAAEAAAADTGPGTTAGREIPYTQLIPGLLALVIAGVGALLYFRKDEP